MRLHAAVVLSGLSASELVVDRYVVADCEGQICRARVVFSFRCFRRLISSIDADCMVPGAAAGTGIVAPGPTESGHLLLISCERARPPGVFLSAVQCMRPHICPSGQDHVSLHGVVMYHAVQ